MVSPDVGVHVSEKRLCTKFTVCHIDEQTYLVKNSLQAAASDVPVSLMSTMHLASAVWMLFSITSLLRIPAIFAQKKALSNCCLESIINNFPASPSAGPGL